ncbi:TPA: CDP-glucose 4,6-dehydratase [Shewanella algae]|uniref:CDP-glucose 4,6-dehydratase n=1 Tax=Shewanella algae TaxID=38313 RepID=UPI001C59AE66|nr:CDP-glucose 4,6-dehydratase [Shewanella algae]HDS1207150.1 CDP-glucose 4,6-dehydratase [Shewanella algae]
MFNNIYLNKKVLVTGHTGFKGTWLTTWLLKLGAEVIGVSDCIPTVPSMFTELNLEDKIEHNIFDVRDLNKLRDLILNRKPDFIFHLAAQPIVSESYLNPLDTISTNVMGTANVLESIRALENACVAIIITSDKCYENVEWEWGYKETDHLGGVDIYSGSKGAAEIIFHSYFKSFFSDIKANVRIATGRAGNVIGGGDWAKDRIVVDCMKNWANGKTVEIRSPNATRPWQHVLEPLSGYLTLGAELAIHKKLTGESFNFGPRAEQTKTVVELLNALSESCDFEGVKVPYEVTDNIPFHEAGLLKLNCDKALYHLKWEPTLYYTECVELVSSWYNEFYNSKQKNMFDLTVGQIEKYETLARNRKLNWVGFNG